jgi:hypothetical protein
VFGLSDRNPSERVLRIPAALVAVGMLALVVISYTLFPQGTLREQVRAYLLLVAMAAPFVLPWSWFRTVTMRNILIGWIGTVAVAATVRSLQSLIYLYPRREFATWLILQALFFMLVAPLWLALAAAWHRRAAH